MVKPLLQSLIGVGDCSLILMFIISLTVAKESALLKKVMLCIKVVYLVPFHLDFLIHLIFQIPVCYYLFFSYNFHYQNETQVQQKFQSLDSLPRKREKKYDYVDAMLDDVIRKYNETQTTRCRTILQPGNPRLIASTIAPFQSPLTNVLVAEMKTRFSQIEPSCPLLVQIE